MDKKSDSLGVVRDASRDHAEFLLGTPFDALPADAVAATKRSIFDTLGVMLAGSGPEATARRVVSMVSAWGGEPTSTVVGHPQRLPAVHAAFANAAMVHQYDFDDTHDEAVAHATANTLAGGLAVAEGLPDCSGRELLTAIALSNDIVCRLGLAIHGSLYEYPWTRPPIIGIWGATAVASRLMGLTAEQIQSAFGFTLHQTANTLECLYATGSEVRGLRDGFSARNGVTAACMAQAGIHGDHSALEGRFGLFNAYFRGEYTRAKLVDGLGRRFENARISIKPWPSARETHATIQAVLELRERHRLSADDVRRVQLYVGRTNLEFCEPADRRRRPARRMDALSSLPFAVAVALQHGSVPLASYTEQGLRDERVLQVAERVQWQLDEQRSEDGTIEGATVEFVLDDGRTLRHSVRHAMGHPDAPLPDEVVIQKFIGCAAMAHRPCTEGQARALWDAVQRLETLSVAAFAAAIPR